MSPASGAAAPLSDAKRALLERLLRGQGAGADAPRGIPRRAGGGAAPLSPAQGRLWLAQRMDADSGVDTLFWALRIAGPLDDHALERALGEVVRRHDILRATFHLEGDAPVQRVAPAGAYALPRADLSGLPPAEREAELQLRVRREAAHTPDLERDPLFRAQLLRMAEGEHVLFLSMHHLISDGWSLGVLFREMDALYRAFERGEPSPLEELPIQYADFAAWQHERLAGAGMAEQVEYWSRQLAGAPSLLELPTDFSRPAVQGLRVGTHRFRLPAALADGVGALARAENATPYMVLLAAFKLLLSRYALQDDVVVGTSVSGRSRREVEGLIGFFVNTVALRTDLGGDPSFRGLLRRVRQTVLDGQTHQDLPFERVVEAVRPERTLSHNPLFQAYFVLQNTPSEGPRLGGLELSMVHGGTGAGRFDLTLSATERGDGVHCNLVYRTDLFTPASVERMAEHYTGLLQAALAAADEPLSRLSPLSDEERERVLEWGTVRARMGAGRCLHHRFEEQAARTPAAVAVTCEGESLSYAGLDARAERIARHLRGLGVGPEVRVALFLERSVEMVAAVLGVLKAGGCYVPLDPV
ncbi:MAG TPA: condensation domain-containing protein, partial [Longimicrobium sp.]